MTGLDWLCLLALSVLWGGAFFFAKVAVATVPPFTLVAARVGLAALALLVVARLAVLRLPADRRTWLAFAGMWLLNNLLPIVLIFYGQTVIGVDLAAGIHGLTTFLTALIARPGGIAPLYGSK